MELFLKFRPGVESALTKDPDVGSPFFGVLGSACTSMQGGPRGNAAYNKSVGDNGLGPRVRDPTVRIDVP